MVFTDASQPAFPDPWDLFSLPAIMDAPDIANKAKADCPELAVVSDQQAKPHAGWRDMLADIQHGLQWGLNH